MKCSTAAAVSSTSKLRDALDAAALHGFDIAAQHAQAVDVVDGVDQHRAAARLAPPGDVEVVLRLVTEPQPVGGDDAADAAAGDDLGGLAHDRVMAAMVADQDRHIGLLAGLDELERLGDGVGDRLLDDDRDLARDAGEADLHVHLVRHRDDGAVRLDAIEHLLDPGVNLIAERLSFGGSAGEGSATAASV